MSVFDRSILILTLFLAGIAIILRPRLVQSGCDSPAHLLMSETLYRIEAPSGSPALRTEIASALEKQGLKETDFSRSLGPLCMHYRNERLGPQYPPLVPLVLSIAPFSSRAQFFGLFCFILFWVAAYRLTGEWAHPISLFSVMPLVLPIFFPDLRSIEGYVPAFALVMMLVHESLRDDASPYVIGGLAATLILCRYDAVFPLLALGVFILSRRPYAPFVLKALTVFLSLGVLPLCYFQLKVIGEAYRALTPSYDLEWVHSFGEFLKASAGSISISQIDLAVLFLVGLASFSPKRPVESRFFKFWIIASVLGGVVILTKTVQTSYYFWAWAAGMYALFLVQLTRFDFTAKNGQRAFRAATAVVLFFALIGSVSGFRTSIEQARLARDWKEAVITRFPRSDRAIVEAGHWSSTLDAFRQSLHVGDDALVIDGTHTSAQVSTALHALARTQKIAWYRFTVGPAGDGPRFERVE